MGLFSFPQRVGSIAEILQALLADIDAGLLGDFGNKMHSLEQTVIKVFISHSSNDVPLATALINLIHKALIISASDIRCTSVPGYKLPGGARTDSQLREELLAAPVFIGLVTEASSSSAYVLIELGARWGANKELIPLMAPGISPEVLEGPISGINALSCSSAADLHSLIAQIAQVLGAKTEPAASYQNDLEMVTKFPVAKLPQASVSSVPQSAVDALAELRADAVGEILNRQVTTDVELAALAFYTGDRCERVEDILQKSFSRAEQLNFSRLGAVPNVIFPHAYNDAHAKILREYALQERRLLDIIARHTH
jgi:lambda repressor-like predicted transcriptional regulator